MVPGFFFAAFFVERSVAATDLRSDGLILPYSITRLPSCPILTKQPPLARCAGEKPRALIDSSIRSRSSIQALSSYSSPSFGSESISRCISSSRDFSSGVALASAISFMNCK